MSIFTLIVRRECLLFYRKKMEFLTVLLFFIIVCVLFPLAISPSTPILMKIGPGIIWVAVLLASLLSLDYLFREDYQDGSLEQWVLSPYPLALLLLTKIIVQWLMFVLPLLLISPLLGMMFHLPTDLSLVLLASLSIGTLLLYLLGALLSSLTLGLRQSRLLLALLLLPLAVPTLIFATGAVLAAEQQLPVRVPFMLLVALLIIALVLVPVVAAFGLRLALGVGSLNRDAFG